MNRKEKRSLDQGFTLVELLVTVIVAGVLVSIAAPNFTDAMRNGQLTVTTNELMGSLRIARSEAIKGSTRTAVCARKTDTECGTDWTNGFIAFIDNGATAGTLEGDERILRVSQGLDGGGRINNKARLVNTNAAPLQRAFIRFGPRGTSHWRGSGYFILCDKRGQESATAINITLNGDPRRARKNGEDLISSFGDVAQCGTSKGTGGGKGGGTGVVSGPSGVSL